MVAVSEFIRVEGCIFELHITLRGIIRVEDSGFKVVHEFQDNASNRGIPWEVDVVLGIFGLIFHG